jgi:hypothetical protein
MRSKEDLTTLCGLSREETELDFSGQDLVAGDAVLIANMGAMTSLNISNNSLGGYYNDEFEWVLSGVQAFAECK